MISKEKLLNGYVKTNNEMLVRLFLSECFKHEDINFPYIYYNVLLEWEYFAIAVKTPCGHSYKAVEDKKELTLEDFKSKPKTKVEYVKCEFESVGECVQAVYDNPELYFYMHSALGEFHKTEYEDAGWYWENKNLYRKVEKEIDWHDEAINYVDGCKHLGPYTTLGSIFSDAFDEEDREFDSEALELCRVILRATGEL